MRQRTNLVPNKLICFYDISTGCDENITGIFGDIVAGDGSKVKVQC
jgi:hypothetical protein